MSGYKLTFKVVGVVITHNGKRYDEYVPLIVTPEEAESLKHLVGAGQLVPNDKYDQVKREAEAKRTKNEK